ncbi:hypothetical protein NL108_004692 [Boleophthalmus pectinirostris]|nr:hypothetical protein NL108_004692 [Boleophthalmus pectinirostris]
MVKLENMECPDLNPMELVWDELDRRVKQPTSATHLWKRLQQTWEELSEEYLISVVKRTSHECVQLFYLPKVDTFMNQKFRILVWRKCGALKLLTSSVCFIVTVGKSVLYI